MQRAKLIALLLLFSFLSLVSLLGVYSTQQLPTEIEQAIPLGTYSHIGNYTYTANLSPNNIYNKTTLKPGEGAIYLRITESINTTFDYKFAMFQLGQANITTEYTANVYLATTKWSKQIDTLGLNKVTFTNASTGQFSFSYLVTLSSIDKMARTINNEIGAFTSAYNVTISPEIRTIATANAGTINEPFNPTLTISFNYGTAGGDYATLEGLQHNNSGVLTQTTKKIYQGWVVLQRYASYASTIITFSALTLAALAFRENKPPPRKPEEPPIEDIIAPYEEIIVEAAKEESLGEEQRTTITLKTLEDLVKVAEGLGKPILHNEILQTRKGEKTTHTFYVLDGLTKYEYTVTAASVKEREGAETEVVTEED